MTVPLVLSLPTQTVLNWMTRLDMTIAFEFDAGRKAMAKELSKIRGEMAGCFPGVQFEPTAVDPPNEATGG